MINKNLSKDRLTQSPDSRSQENAHLDDNTNSGRQQKTVKIITIQEETSPTPITCFPWSGQDWSLQEDCLKTLQHSTPRKIKQGPHKLFFWETLVTVGFLVMALWMQMQTLPTRQLPETIDSESIMFEMMDAQTTF
ncbi:MAG: hypothetical protein AAGF26_11075 [Cyanobacteria bacterium P01_G01_bin.49]